MEKQGKLDVVITKDKLQTDFSKINLLLREYGAHLTQNDFQSNWKPDTVRLMRAHLAFLARTRTSLRTYELVQGLITYVLKRLKKDTYRFSGKSALPDNFISTTLDKGAPPTEEDFKQLASKLYALAKTAPLEQQEKLRALLANTNNLFEELRSGDKEKSTKTLQDINLLTTSKQNQMLLNEIAHITREIYDSLVNMSDELPLESLSESSGGLTDAVYKLNGVIVRLEEAALENLDQIELLSSKAQERQTSMTNVLATLREAQNNLMRIKGEHNSLAAEMDSIQERLSDEVGARVMTLRYNLETASQAYMEMVARQGFHDLAGQTLKRTISFIETLEKHLLELLKQYKPVLEMSGITKKEKADGTSEEQMSKKEATQDDVDALLGELGF
ncbi:MAG: protein phosphatase CheZ [Deltaproteobacteria bacterium]|nr:protein phosphatase CheZ [Deltaproteobacteria bacterium]